MLATCSFKSVGRRRRKQISTGVPWTIFWRICCQNNLCKRRMQTFKPAPKLFSLPCYSETGRPVSLSSKTPCSWKVGRRCRVFTVCNYGGSPCSSVQTEVQCVLMLWHSKKTKSLFRGGMKQTQCDGMIFYIDAIEHCYPSTTVSVMRSMKGTALIHCLPGKSVLYWVLPCMFICLSAINATNPGLKIYRLFWKKWFSTSKLLQSKSCNYLLFQVWIHWQKSSWANLY